MAEFKITQKQFEKLTKRLEFLEGEHKKRKESKPEPEEKPEKPETPTTETKEEPPKKKGLFDGMFGG